MIEKGLILVPTDFSEMCTEALRRAVRIAERFPAKIEVIHVLAPPMPLWTDEMGLGPLPVEWTETLHKAAERRIHDFIAEVKDIEVSSAIVEDADPADAVCRWAEQKQADLIVVGKHSRKQGISRWLLGSTTEKIVRHAPCSV
ncbi:MAG: universal stress protein, partial [Zetaproteobacteria bacterium]